MTPLAGPILTAAQMRAAEQAEIATGTSVEALMARAGAAVAEAVWRFGGGRPALILCGPGNNGGDGYVAARLLKARGLKVCVVATGEPRTPAAIAARGGWNGPVASLAAAEPAPVLVDALFGTGLSRGLDTDLGATAARLAAEARFVLAVDLPSGVETDSGAQLGPVTRADATLALGALKPAHLLQPAASLCGHVSVADIGVAVESATRVLDPPHLAPPGPRDHKYSRGMLGIVAGEMPGAAALCAMAAARLAGYVVTTGVVDGPHAIVVRDWAQLGGDKRLGAVLAGPGLGRSNTARDALEAVLDSPHSLVLDADALTLMGEPGLRRLAGRPAILTPHDGEFGSLFGDLQGTKIDRARAAAARSGAIIVLKGADTVVAAPDGRVAVSPGASSWLASAGTGDVLAGIAGALLATGLPPYEAACAAVWLHRDAARRAGPALIADDLAAHLPAAVAACL